MRASRARVSTVVCAARGGGADLQALVPWEESGKPAFKPFHDDVLGFVYVDVKYLPPMHGED
jgi:hypothetical protein